MSNTVLKKYEVLRPFQFERSSNVNFYQPSSIISTDVYNFDDFCSVYLNGVLVGKFGDAEKRLTALLNGGVIREIIH